MPIGQEPDRIAAGSESAAHAFYVSTMEALNEAALPYLVGGGHALAHYTGNPRAMKDFDIFVQRDTYGEVMRVLERAGCHTELTFPHWLGKASCARGYVDVIFSSGNGVTPVDAAWFQHGTQARVLGVPARLCPVEEMIWTKAFVMERERYDCADIMHLLLSYGESLDWKRLMARFGPHWRVLFSHLCLFGFVYPSERNRIPRSLMTELTARLMHETESPRPTLKLCQGTLLSREQYLVDVQSGGFVDARHTASSSMTPSDIMLWTQAIQHKE